MDASDFRLLAAIGEDARQSLQALGRRVSLSAPAVRERLHRLETRGILQGYWVSIDPEVFGRRDLLVSFNGEWSREDAVEILEAMDVTWVAWKLDGGVTVQLWPYDITRALTALAEFVGREPKWHGVTRSEWTGELSRLDWRVLDVLIDDPRAPIEQLAVATGLSPKTIRKHIMSMTRSEAIFVIAHLGALRDSGDLVYHLLVSGTASLSAIHRALGEAVLVHETQDPPRRYLFCRADSLGDLTARTHALERIPGVSSVQVTLNREMFIGTKFLHALVRERIEMRQRNRQR